MKTVGRIVRLPSGRLGVLIHYGEDAKPGQHVCVHDEAGCRLRMAILGQPYADPSGIFKKSGFGKQYEEWVNGYGEKNGSNDPDGKPKKRFLFRAAFIYGA